VAGSDREDLATTMRDLERAQSVVQERSATTRSFFDARAAEWDRLSREVLGDLDLPAQVGAILGLLRSRPESAVDIGCGTGTLLEVLAATAARSIGVDSSPRMLERARRRFEGRPEVEVRLGEAEHLPLGDGEAQLVLMSMTLHHLAEPEAGLREVARVTTRGGSLLIVELAPHDLEDLRDAQGDRWLGFDRGELLALARGAGYELAEERSFDLPRGLGLATYLFRKTMNGGARNGQRKDLRGS
jgi:ArsR family transcriptional regulator